MSQAEPVLELKNGNHKMLFDKKSKVLFGEYLLCKGKINEDDLELALKFQKEEHVTLGALAVKEDCLTNQQLSAILDKQREEGRGLFGEIAIKMGFLNRDDVDKLLEVQRKKRILIGDILVLFGAIGKEDMEDELKQFHELVGKK